MYAQLRVCFDPTFAPRQIRRASTGFVFFSCARIAHAGVGRATLIALAIAGALSSAPQRSAGCLRLLIPRNEVYTHGQSCRCASGLGGKRSYNRHQ